MTRLSDEALGCLNRVCGDDFDIEDYNIIYRALKEAGELQAENERLKEESSMWEGREENLRKLLKEKDEEIERDNKDIIRLIQTKEIVEGERDALKQKVEDVKGELKESRRIRLQQRALLSKYEEAVKPFILALGAGLNWPDKEVLDNTLAAQALTIGDLRRLAEVKEGEDTCIQCKGLNDSREHLDVCESCEMQNKMDKLKREEL